MKETRMLRALLAAVVLGAIVTPIAVASAQGHPATRPSPQAIARKLLKRLKGQTATMTGEVAALRAKISVLSEPKTPPPSPPSGPAGGDLSGSYPNPKIRVNSITSAEVADGTLTSEDIAANTVQPNNIADGAIGPQDIANGSIAQVDLGAGSVGAPQLVSTHVVKAGPTFAGSGGTDEQTASCPPGEQLLAGGGGWTDIQAGLVIVASRPDENVSNQWDVLVHNGSGNGVNFFAYALCLRAG